MKTLFWKPLLGMLCISLAASAHADMIVAYDAANSPDGSPASSWLSGVTPLELMRGEGLSAGTGATYNSSNWTDEPTDYLQWGWSNSTPVNLTDLDLRYDRSSSGPATIQIQLSVNGGAFQTVFFDSDVSASGEDALDIDLSPFTAVSSATFRLLGGSASSAGGTFDIEPITGLDPAYGIVVNGSVAAVPEPTAFSLLTVATCALAFWRRVRR